MRLIGELNRLQAEMGYLTAEGLGRLSERLGVPLYRLEEVVSFYPHFRTDPPPKGEISICRDISCHLAGSEAFHAAIEQALSGDDDIEVHRVPCLGRCDRAPAALLNGMPVAGLTAKRLVGLARGGEAPGGEPAGSGRSWKIDIYGDGGDGPEPFSVYRMYRDRPPEEGAAEVIQTLKDAGLVGMGGAGFPTGLKWELVRRESAAPKYVICNADESEPGTFKDRVIMAELPHLVIEGMRLAAYVVGAERGWIYIRHEYEPERQALERALDMARDAGILGDGFDIEIFVSPGGYILGEETALLEALEDKRGEPRNKPPYPGQKGLWSRPTLINNVETLAFVPAILRRGPVWWKAQGVRGHAGLKFIGVSGHVKNPGVFEIPMGTTVAELIALAGGVRDGHELKAFAPGGASSSFLPASRADVEIDFKSMAEAGSMLGSAALVVLDDTTDMIDAAANVVHFFRDESCGKCVPCRTGTEKVARMLDDVLAGRGDGGLLRALPDLEVTLAQTSICGLGQVALNPIVSALRHWGDELNVRRV